MIWAPHNYACVVPYVGVLAMVILFWACMVGSVVNSLVGLMLAWHLLADDAPVCPVVLDERDRATVAAILPPHKNA